MYAVIILSELCSPVVLCWYLKTFNSLLIANGRIGDDSSFDHFTFINANGKSVIDYCFIVMFWKESEQRLLSHKLLPFRRGIIINNSFIACMPLLLPIIIHTQRRTDMTVIIPYPCFKIDIYNSVLSWNKYTRRNIRIIKSCFLLYFIAVRITYLKYNFK